MHVSKEKYKYVKSVNINASLCVKRDVWIRVHKYSSIHFVWISFLNLVVSLRVKRDVWTRILKKCVKTEVNMTFVQKDVKMCQNKRIDVYVSFDASLRMYTSLLSHLYACTCLFWYIFTYVYVSFDTSSRMYASLFIHFYVCMRLFRHRHVSFDTSLWMYTSLLTHLYAWMRLFWLIFEYVYAFCITFWHVYESVWSIAYIHTSIVTLCMFIWVSK